MNEPYEIIPSATPVSDLLIDKLNIRGVRCTAAAAFFVKNKFVDICLGKKVTAVANLTTGEISEVEPEYDND